MKKIKRKHNIYKSHKMSADKAAYEMKEDLMKKIKRKHNIYKSDKMSADKAAYEMMIQKQLMYLI